MIEPTPPAVEAQNLHNGLPRKSQESDFRPGESEVPLRYLTENIKKEVGISGKKCLDRG